MLLFYYNPMKIGNLPTRVNYDLTGGTSVMASLTWGW